MTDQRRFESQFPWMTTWWQEHLGDRPVVVIECAECHKKIGEIKRDAQHVMALRRTRFPEPTVPRPDIIVAVADEADEASALAAIEARKAERQAHVLKPGAPTADGCPTDIMKQNRQLADAVAPLSTFTSYVCPVHGELAVDVAALRAFVDDTLNGTCKYPLGR